LKSFITILLAFTFLFQSAGKLIVVAKYSLNKDFISTVLCENKAKPILKCNGKCHLKKELQKEEKKENSPSNNVKEKFEIQFFCSVEKANQPLQAIPQEKLISNYLFSNSSKHLAAIFHPPQA
jgi:hypothetical protein